MHPIGVKVIEEQTHRQLEIVIEIQAFHADFIVDQLFSIKRDFVKTTTNSRFLGGAKTSKSSCSIAFGNAAVQHQIFTGAVLNTNVPRQSAPVSIFLSVVTTSGANTGHFDIDATIAQNPILG